VGEKGKGKEGGKRVWKRTGEKGRGKVKGGGKGGRKEGEEEVSGESGSNIPAFKFPILYFHDKRCVSPVRFYRILN